MNIDPQYLAIVVTIIIHAFASIWWASKLNTTMEFLQKNIEEISKIMNVYEATRYTKEEAAKDFAVRDQQISAIWKKVDAQHG